MKISFEYVTSLQYEWKACQRELEAFRSGQKYVSMKEKFNRQLRSLEAIIKKLREELHQAYLGQKKIGKIWFETCEEMQKTFDKREAELLKEIRRQEERACKAERQRDEAIEKAKELRLENYRMGTQLEETQGLVVKLTAQVNQDFENSSLPSSAQSVQKKKIPNSRERSGKKPGAQPGHPHYPRKRQEPTEKILLQPAEEVLNNPDFRKTGKTITKQQINLSVVIEVTEYMAEEYRSRKTGERYHAPFPEGVVDDINYGASVKGFVFLLNHHCCVSIDKCSAFLSDLTDGKIRLSKGMINKLSKEFSKKSKAQRQAILSELMRTRVVHTDCTVVRINGRNGYVYICTAPKGAALYTASESKGIKGAEKTPLKDYTGILVHDHESTFYHYGTQHQECMAHILRYLKEGAWKMSRSGSGTKKCTV